MRAAVVGSQVLEAHALELDVAGQHPVARQRQIARAFEQLDRALEERVDLAHPARREGRALGLHELAGTDDPLDGVTDTFDVCRHESERGRLIRATHESLRQLLLGLVNAATERRGRVERGGGGSADARPGQQQHVAGIAKDGNEEIVRDRVHASLPPMLAPSRKRSKCLCRRPFFSRRLSAAVCHLKGLRRRAKARHGEHPQGRPRGQRGKGPAPSDHAHKWRDQPDRDHGQGKADTGLGGEGGADVGRR